MYKRVIATVRFHNAASESTFKNTVAGEESKHLFFEKVNEIKGRSGQRVGAIDMRATQPAGSEKIYQTITTLLKSQNIEGQVSIHNCYHDEGPPFQQCIIDKKFSTLA